MGPGKVRKQPWPLWTASLTLRTLEILAFIVISAWAFYEGERNQICSWGVGNGLKRLSQPSQTAFSPKAEAEKLPQPPQSRFIN